MRRASVAELGGEQAVLDRDDPVPAGGGVEAALQLALLARRAVARLAVVGPVAGLAEAVRAIAGRGVAEGVLELVAIAPGFQRGDDRLELEAVEAADAAQGVVDLGVLDLQLALVGEHLPGHAGMVGERGDPLGPGLEHLERARVGVGALALVDERADTVAGDGAGDEHDVAAVPEARDALAAVGERVDRSARARRRARAA